MTEQNRDLRSHPSFIIVWTDAAFAEGENRMKFLKNTMLMAFEPRGFRCLSEAYAKKPSP
jgi:hypothetical protein